jgi:hypothetical protein
MKAEKLFLVQYGEGDYPDYCKVIIFATPDRGVAKNYVVRFNTLLQRYKDFYKKFEVNNPHHFSTCLLKEEFYDYYDRYIRLYDIDKCFYEEIEKR